MPIHSLFPLRLGGLAPFFQTFLTGLVVLSLSRLGLAIWHAEAVSAGLADPIRTCGGRDCGAYATTVGLVLIWIAAVLTLITGWDYFRKALPYLKDH